MKLKKILPVLTIFLFLTSVVEGWAGETVFDKADQYHFCHRCGMAVEKSDHVITVNDVPAAPWYECCPVCASMDIIESANGTGSIKGYDQIDGQPIQIVVHNNTIKKIDPPNALILVGGSCPKNKFFAHRNTASTFVNITEWANKKMLKTVPQVYASLSDKKKAITRCAMCSTALKDHEKTHFTIMTKDKKRLVACCGHCGLLMMHKLKDQAIRAVTPDFGTGQLIDAKKAFYVVDNDLMVCCFPSTISFSDRNRAETFQKKHKGKIVTFDQALGNMKEVMGK